MKHLREMASRLNLWRKVAFGSPALLLTVILLGATILGSVWLFMNATTLGPLLFPAALILGCAGYATAAIAPDAADDAWRRYCAKEDQ